MASRSVPGALRSVSHAGLVRPAIKTGIQEDRFIQADMNLRILTFSFLVGAYPEHLPQGSKPKNPCEKGYSSHNKCHSP
jgi:hypothetical protein